MRKKGSIEILCLTLFMTIMILITGTLYFLYMQINGQVISIRKDIFYIVQNAFFSLQSEELAYENYVIDQTVLTERIATLITKSYHQVKIEEIQYNEREKKVEITLQMTVTPVLLSSKIGKIPLLLHEKIKLRNMEVIS